MFCRLKDYRRIATRYDKLAGNFLSAIYLAAAVKWWLRVPTLERRSSGRYGDRGAAGAHHQQHEKHRDQRARLRKGCKFTSKLLHLA
jgi:hypothetical protein